MKSRNFLVRNFIQCTRHVTYVVCIYVFSVLIEQETATLTL